MVTANANYHIAGITTNGVDIPGSPYTANGFVGTNYVWNNVVTDGTINATFAIDTYTLTVNSQHGTPVPSGVTTSV